jgi:hypothetical protein
VVSASEIESFATDPCEGSQLSSQRSQSPFFVQFVRTNLGILVAIASAWLQSSTKFLRNNLSDLALARSLKPMQRLYLLTFSHSRNFEKMALDDPVSRRIDVLFARLL